MYIIYKIYLQWIYWTLFFIARCSTIFASELPEQLPSTVCIVASAPMFVNAFYLIDSQFGWLLVEDCMIQQWYALNFFFDGLYDDFRGASHYRQRSRGHWFQPIILRETKSSASRPFTLRPKSKGCRNFKWLLFEEGGRLSKEVWAGRK